MSADEYGVALVVVVGGASQSRLAPADDYDREGCPTAVALPALRVANNGRRVTADLQAPSGHGSAARLSGPCHPSHHQKIAAD
jgi:hypothetical protein